MTDKRQIQVAAAVLQTGTPLLTLALRKSGGELSGHWEFPGGKQEPGETLRDCLVREIKEELGLSIVTGQYIGVSNYNTESTNIALHGFLVHEWSGEMQLTEHDAVKWLSSQQLSSLKWCPADLPIVSTVVERYSCP